MTPAEVRAHLYAKPGPACVAEGETFRRSPIGSRVTNNHRALVRSGIAGDDLRYALIARINVRSCVRSSTTRKSWTGCASTISKAPDDD